jgi:hypothetical protein
MDGEADILGFRAHFDRRYRFGDEIAGALGLSFLPNERPEERRVVHRHEMGNGRIGRSAANLG